MNKVLINEVGGKFSIGAGYIGNNVVVGNDPFDLDQLQNYMQIWREKKIEVVFHESAKHLLQNLNTATARVQNINGKYHRYSNPDHILHTEIDQRIESRDVLIISEMEKNQLSIGSPVNIDGAKIDYIFAL